MLKFFSFLLKILPLHYAHQRNVPKPTPRSCWLAVFAAAALCAGLPGSLSAQEALFPGEAFITKFSGTATADGRTTIDLSGIVGTSVDLRAPRFAPDGRHWLDELHRFSVTAGDVGQVFGVTLDDANPPNIYLSATSAFGLHLAPGTSQWMPGLWGQGGEIGRAHV